MIHDVTHMLDVMEYYVSDGEEASGPRDKCSGSGNGAQGWAGTRKVSKREATEGNRLRSREDPVGGKEGQVKTRTALTLLVFAMSLTAGKKDRVWETGKIMA